MISAEDALELVLSWAGAFPRDPMNVRTVDEVRNGTGRLGKIDDDLLSGVGVFGEGSPGRSHFVVGVGVKRK